MPDDDLVRVLGEVQRRGGIGPVVLADAIAHARQYVRALELDHLDRSRVDPALSPLLIDLGSGGGLPALVIAHDLPHWRARLVERRAKRADLLRYAVRSLGLMSRVTVDDRDVERLIGATPALLADAVTARSFAPLPTTLRIGAALSGPGGVIVVSEPPAGHGDLPTSLVDQLGLLDLGVNEGVHRFRRVSS